jgi:glycosyltransferase involved in cell wall biosynthesis
MTRYVSIKNENIQAVSNEIFARAIRVPDELNNVSSDDLIINYRVRNGQFKNKNNIFPANELKIGFVSDWKIHCGIAQYGEKLCSELVKYVNDVKIFAEIGVADGYEANVIRCWERGEPMMDLVRAIKEYDPDVVLINHEHGIFPDARHWLSLMNQLSEYRIIVIEHSVFHHKDKTICEAAMPEIIVHLEGAKKVLKEEKKVSGIVYVIPHGSSPCVAGKLWNMYHSDRTFLQVGYGFHYKQYQACIKAVAILKQKYEDVFFTGIFSESDYAKLDHQLYYNELMALVSELGVEENVGIIRGYQSDEALDSYFRTNVATVFPYVSSIEHEVFGASGAVRTAMSKGLPVITSNVNHFSDVPSIKANTPEEIAVALEKVFDNAEYREAQVKKQCKYIEETSWENVGKMYRDVLERKTTIT